MAHMAGAIKIQDIFAISTMMADRQRTSHKPKVTPHQQRRWSD
jgi:hypothetical protein